jgi:hypothetical protein
LPFKLKPNRYPKIIVGRLISIVNEINAYGNFVSFALLFDAEDNLSEYEKRKMGSLKVKSSRRSAFKDHINFVFEQNSLHFGEISNSLRHMPENIKSSHLLSDLELFLMENELQLYFPFKDNFTWDDLKVFTVTYEDYNPDARHDGFVFSGLEG